MRPKVSAKDLLSKLCASDAAESKNKELFFVPPGRSEPKPFKLASPEPVKTPVKTPAQELEAYLAEEKKPQPTKTWVTEAEELLKAHDVVLIVKTTDNCKAFPLDSYNVLAAQQSLKNYVDSKPF